MWKMLVFITWVSFEMLKSNWNQTWVKDAIEYRSDDVTKNIFWISVFWIPCIGGA